MKMNIVPIVTILAAALLATCGVEAADEGLPGSPEEYETLSASLNKWVRLHTFPTAEPEECSTMIAAYVSKPVEADKYYLKKKCREAGFVRNIGKGAFDATVVTLVGSLEDVTRPGDVKGVNCFFPKIDVEPVAKLKPSDRVIIRGTCYGKSGKGIVLLGCHVDTGTPGPQTSTSIDKFEEQVEEIGKKARAFNFQNSEPVDCALLIAAYAKDEAGADKMCRGKMSRIIGFVRGRGKDVLGRTVVTLVGSTQDVTRLGDERGMNCYFPNSEAEQMEKLKPLDRVIVRGGCEGQVDGYILLLGCHVDTVIPGAYSTTLETFDENGEWAGKQVRAFKFPDIATERCATIVAAYMNNEPQADKFYNRKMCRTTGYVRGTEKDAIAKTVVVLVGYAEDVKWPGDVKGINCYFPQSEAVSMARLKPSDHVIIRGMCLGKTLNRVMLVGCHVDVAAAEAPVDPDEKYDENVEVIGKRVREFKFPSSEADEVKTMIALFDANEAQAEQRYKNKTCREIGYVRQKGKDVLGKIIVTVVGNVEDVRRSGDVKGVDCYFPKSEVDSVLTLKPSDAVVIRGLCGGRSSGRLFMLGCHIDDASPKRQ